MRTVSLVIVAVLMSGCQSARVPDPITAKLGGNDADAQMEFWHTLAGRNLCSNDEAFHGLLLFLDGQDPATDYAGRVAALKKRGLLHATFDQPADRAVERGTLAVAIVRTLKVKGGLFQHLTNDHPRYATRELMFMELYPLSSPNQTFSGTEFVGVIGKLEDYQRGNPADYPAAVLPGEAASGANPGSTQTPATTNPTLKEGAKPTPPTPATVNPDVQDPKATPTRP
jgi:hypothetical protein